MTAPHMDGGDAIRTAIVTGATRGIGKVIAVHLASRGYRVAVAGRSADRAARVVSEIVESGGTATFFSCDMSVEADVAALFESVAKTWGPIDVVVNNAAKTDITTSDRAVTEQITERFDSFMRANAYSVFWSFKYGIPALRDGKGSFVTISSITAVVSGAAEPSYAASKAAGAALTRQVAVDYGPQGVRANVLMLGFIETNASASLLTHGPVGPVVRAATPGRIPSSLDVAKAVAYLAEDCGFNGATLTLDGGMTVHSHIPVLG